MSVLSPIQRSWSIILLAFILSAIFSSSVAASPSFEISLKNAEGSDVQAVYVEATTGQFRLSFGSGGPGVSETGDIDTGASPAQVEDALNSLTNISAGGGSVSVTVPGADTNGTLPYLVAFNGGSLALQLQPLMNATNGSVPLGASPLGGGPATAYVTTWVPGGIRRGDERTDYTIDISNTASSVPGAGDELVCNGAPAPLGTKEWFRQATTGYSFEFQWLRNGVASTGWIAGAAGRTYTLVPADAGQPIQCLVKGTNGTGSGSFVVASQPTVVAAPAAPSEPPRPNSANLGSRRPAIAGPLKAETEVTAGAEWKEGEELRCTAPTAGWSASNEQSPITWSFRWLRDGAPALGAVTSPTPTTSRYSLTSDDVAAPAAPAVFQCVAIATNAAGLAALVESAERNTKAPPVGTPAFAENTSDGAPFQAPGQVPVIETTNSTSGPVAVQIELPAGVESFLPGTEGAGWSCSTQPPSGTELAKTVCTRTSVLAPGESYPSLNVAVALGADAADALSVKATVSGGGAPSPASAINEFSFSPFPGFGFIPDRFSARALDSAGEDYTQAGGHPAVATTSVSLNRIRSLIDDGAATERYKPAATVRDVIGDIPPGFIGNPQAIPDLCPSTSDMVSGDCPPASVVGEVGLLVKGIGNPAFGSNFRRYPLYALEPENGVPAEFAVVNTTSKGVYVLRPHLRADDSYAISIESKGILENPPILDLRVMLCSYGANILFEGAGAFKFESCKQKGEPGANPKPFLTTQTECASAGPVTQLHADSWANPGQLETAEAIAPKMTGCDLVPFEPGMSLEPTTKEAESASGLDVDISFSSEGLEDPDGLSQAHLKRAIVTLPQGMSVNPASADGLAACTQAQLGMVDGVPNDEPVQCPDASKIGTVELTTPILAETLKGNVYLAKQGDNPFGTLLGLYVVAESKERGLLIKIPGRVDVKDNGQLVSTFDDNPQAPFSSLALHFNKGARAPLMTPQRCGTYQITSELTPWSAEDPDNPTAAETVTKTSPFEIAAGPAGGPCPNGSLQPKLDAGLSSTLAGTSSPFVVNLSRDDGTQRFNGLSMTLPPGLSANLTGVPYCSDAVLNSIPTAEGTGAAEIANPSCPEPSRLGSVLVGAGAGKPFYVNTGKVYLAGPYKGAPVSLAVVVPAVAGPFDLGNVVVRNPAFVNPKTAQITVASDPLPTALHNLPIDVRSIRVTVDRPGFMQAPTSCEPMTIDAIVTGEEGGSVPVSNRFQVGECGNLGFKPNLKLRLKGGTKRGKYQQLTATLTARPGDANIAFTSVRFPQSIFLAQEHIGTVCTRVQFAADACPPRSVYGHAEAVTPLLDQPLVGPVYLRSSDNVLPDLVAALRGPDSQPIEVELVGRTDSKNRGNRNTFDVVPDAPVSKFTLRMMGGKKSLLVTSRNLCLRKERAFVRMRGQNGMARSFRPVLRTACKKKHKKARTGKKRR